MRLPNAISSHGLDSIKAIRERSEPFAAVNFVVTLNTSIYGFQSVSGITIPTQYDYVTEGGRNDYPILLKRPQSSAHKLIFKRGYKVRSALGLLPFVSNILGDGPLFEGNQVGTLFVLGRDREIKAMFGFITMGLEEWSMSDLNAQNPELCIETFTIVHKGLVDIPIASIL